jgi:hypothetical protein
VILPLPIYGKITGMKRLMLVFPLLALLLMAADRPVTVQFKIINKSGFALAIWLTGTAIDPGTNFLDLLLEGKKADTEEQDTITYYFVVPKGSRADPTIKSFEIARGQYTLRAQYTKPWDPVYPDNPCIQQPPKPLIALRNTQLTFTPCFLFPPNAGEPSMMKFWQFRKQLLY